MLIEFSMKEAQKTYMMSKTFAHSCWSSEEHESLKKLNKSIKFTSPCTTLRRNKKKMYVLPAHGKRVQRKSKK